MDPPSTLGLDTWEWFKWLWRYDRRRVKKYIVVPRLNITEDLLQCGSLKPMDARAEVYSTIVNHSFGKDRLERRLLFMADWRQCTRSP